MEQIFQQTIFDPLEMFSSSSSTPLTSEKHRAVISGEPSVSFVVDGSIGVISGGPFSVTCDLAKLEHGMLDSKQLSAERTRRWLKPR